ncbi:MAG: RNA-binding transcriptional accessory protein [Myxococcales bacterium]
MKPEEIVARVAAATALPSAGVAGVLALVGEGATVPFIARYRKERTGGLDEAQIRAAIATRDAIVALEERRDTVLASLDEQGVLTNDLRAAVLAADSRQALEDLYLPFRPKRRTRATKARERGLGPLGELILQQPLRVDPRTVVRPFVGAHPEVPDDEAAWAGARDVAAEAVCERADVREMARDELRRRGELRTTVIKGKETEGARFETYFDHREPIRSIPSHRVLAALRGEAEGVLRLSLEAPEDAIRARAEWLAGVDARSPLAGQLREAVADGCKRLLLPAADTAIRAALRERADLEAVEVFGRNLHGLLMAPPFGGRPTVAVDPGLRTGAKVAALDATGAVRLTATVTTIGPRASESKVVLARLIKAVRAEAIALGNGTGSREAEAVVRDALAEAGVDIPVATVDESGASVYSASELARQEMPDLDVTLRGAVSIGRRLQDPLAELVKIDPKSLGVGQYQHDVDQTLLARRLHDVVEDCVNRVGVELNTASPALLSYVAGIGPALANAIVEHRNHGGPFKDRKALLAVKKLGPRTFEQCAGFLRIREATNPLDRTAVHPERYALVERMARDAGVAVAALVGHPEHVERLDRRRYAEAGELTVADILDELRRPGRDPRPRLEESALRKDLRDLADLKPDMVLPGRVTNVTHFGAFVDVGVHQDGLVHISQLADRFVRDPHEVVSVGALVRVRVVEVDLRRRRIALSMKGLPAS